MTSLPTTSAGPAAQPIRNPGEKILENVPACSTTSGASDHRLGGGAASFSTRAETELAVGHVLQDQEVVAAGQVNQLLPALRAHRQAGGVLVVGDRVDDLRSQPAGQQVCEHVDPHPGVVDGHAAHVGLVAAERHQPAQVGRRLDDDDVAGIDVALGEQFHAVDAAAGDHQLARAGGPAVGGRQPPGDVIPDAGQALGGRVLQRHPRLVGDQAGGDVGQGAGLERGRLGEPAGERDDVGGAGQGEDRRDLRAAQRVRAAREPLVPVAAGGPAILVASIKALLRPSLRSSA